MRLATRGLPKPVSISGRWVDDGAIWERGESIGSLVSIRGAAGGCDKFCLV